MLDKFYERNKVLIGSAGFIATICGLFLNISAPTSDLARSSLENIQIFCLIALIFNLILVFIRVIRALWVAERELGKKYAAPTAGVLTMAMTYAFSWIVLNLLSFVINAHPQSAGPLSMGIGFLIILGTAIFPIALTEKYKDKFSTFSYLVIFSFSMAELLSFAGATLQLVIIKVVYPYWGFAVFPGLFILIFIVGGILVTFKKPKAKLQ